MAGRAARPLVVALPLLAAAVLGGHAIAAPRTELVVRVDGGPIVGRYRLAEGDEVVLRYRNSLYGSLAEERFRVEGGRLLLASLAADERAVLEEYYVTEGGSRPAAPGESRSWQATPQDPLVLDRLAVAATDLGERALLVEGQPPLELWRLVEDGRPTVLLELRPAR